MFGFAFSLCYRYQQGLTERDLFAELKRQKRSRGVAAGHGEFSGMRSPFGTGARASMQRVPNDGPSLSRLLKSDISKIRQARTGAAPFCALRKAPSPATRADRFGPPAR